MEIATRYILIQAIKTNDNEIIPIWDDRIKYEKDIDGSKSLLFNGLRYISSIEALFDLKTKSIILGVELNHYPSEKELTHKKGDEVMLELSHRVLSKQTIVDIVYKKYDLTIGKGSKIEWWSRFFHLDANTMYAIKSWKPYYVLDNGETIEYEFKLFKIKNN